MSPRPALLLALALALSLTACSGDEPGAGGASASSLPAPPEASPVDVGDPVELDGDYLDANGSTVLTHSYPDPGDRDTAQHLWAYDAATGEERWELDFRVPADSGYSPGSQVQMYGSAVLGASADDPVVASYVEGDASGDPQSGVTALDPDDGSLLWQWLAPASVQADTDGRGTTPIGVVDGVVVVRTGPPGFTTGPHVGTWGLDAGTGAVLWHVHENLDVVGTTVVAGDPNRLQRSRAAVIDPATGRATWTGPKGTAIYAAAGRWLVLYQGRSLVSAEGALVDLGADDPEIDEIEVRTVLGQTDGTEPLTGWTEPAAGGGLVLHTVGPDDDQPGAVTLDADHATDVGGLAVASGGLVASQYLEGVWLLARDGSRQGDRVEGVLQALGPDYLVTTNGGASQDPQVLLHPLG